jgi:agmatinase
MQNPGQSPGPQDSLASPRFCGVPTFMRLPLAATPENLDVAIIGLPSDNGSPFRTGARFGPNAIRAMSVMLRPINPYRGGLDIFSALRVADFGDAPVVPGYQESTLEHLAAALARIVSQGAIPLSLGGDHSVSLPALRVLGKRHGKLALVHFDSHTDTWDSYFAGKRYSAGTPFRRAVEEGWIDPARSIQIGMRGSLFRPDDVSQSEGLGYQVITTDQIFALGLAETARRIAARAAGVPCYLTFDLDFVDPAAAPGVQTPESGGPTAREALALLRAIEGLAIAGADVVETNPLFDGPGQVTALLAATIAAEILAMIAAARS